MSLLPSQGVPMTRSLSVFLLALLPASVAGQRVDAARWQSWSPTLRVSTNAPAATSLRRDYRLEGLVVGGLVFGAVGAWIGAEACHNQPQPIGAGSGQSCTGDAGVVGLAGAAQVSGLGYLLGRLTPKQSPRLEPRLRCLLSRSRPPVAQAST